MTRLSTQSAGKWSTDLQNHPGFASGQAAASSGPGSADSTVKHHLSRELQLYFDRVTTAAFDDFDERARTAGLASLSGDPGLHQVVPYLVQFAAEKVSALSTLRVAGLSITRVGNILPLRRGFGSTGDYNADASL